MKKKSFITNLVFLTSLSLILTILSLIYIIQLDYRHLLSGTEAKAGALDTALIENIKKKDYVKLSSLLYLMKDDRFKTVKLTLLNDPENPIYIGKIYPVGMIKKNVFLTHNVKNFGEKLADIEVSCSWTDVARSTSMRVLPVMVVLNMLVVIFGFLAQLPYLRRAKKLTTLFHSLAGYDGSEAKRTILTKDGTYSDDPDIQKIVHGIAAVIEKERKMSQREQENERLIAIGTSTAMVAHDVRKPLTSMKALLSSLPVIKDDPKQLETMIAGVDQSIARTNTLLNDIMEFSRDATVLNLGETDPQGVIVSALSDALRNHSDEYVKIVYDMKHSHVLNVDSNRIIRVLVNVIDNALDAMKLPNDKKSPPLLQIVTNEIEREGKQFISISVADTGPGLSEKALAKVFDPFFTQGKQGGTGLGLAICHRIISMHGGKIEAANRTDGSGAMFTIELPAGEKPAGINEAELIYSSDELKPFRKEEAARVEYGDTANTSEFMRINKEKGRSSYLLIVDDEPLFRESIRCLLSELGQVKDHVKVVEADSAEKALTLFQSQKFDYVIADIDLGKRKMNGYEFAGMVLDKYPNSYVLIHSNKRRDEMDKNIRQIGGDKFMGFLPKPMRSSELLQFLACKTFEVTAKGRHPDSSESGRKDLHILLVNDDEELRIALKWQIKAAGNMQVIEASDVGGALSKIAGDNIDIILSDINLGEGEPSGYDLLKKVREDGKSKAKFYMVSGYSKESEEQNALSLGADGYCQLPLEDDHLKKVLNG